MGITYLNPIIAIGNQTCRGLELTFLGGYPEFYGGLYTIDLMSNGNPIAEDLTTGYGGKLLVEDLNYGESIGISVVDPQGCDQVLPIQTYIFQEPTVSFTAMDNAYCSQEAPVALTGNPLPGTAPPNVSYTVTIYRDTAPNQNSFEITDNTNTVVYSRSGSQISSYPSYPENKAVFNTGPLPASGCPYTFKINDSGGNGQAVCINNQATGGYIIYDNISGQFWPPTGPEIGNWGASDTWLLGCPPDHILTASFVGPGITDNTDGTATFNPNIAGPGIHTICYNLTYDGLCDFQSCQTIEVTAQPVINPINDITVCYPPGQLFNLTTIPLTGAFLGIATLEWLNDNSGSPGTPVANPTAVPTGTYWLRATTTATTDATETCVAVDQFSVIVSSTPVINPIPPQEDCEQFDLTTTPLIDANGLNYATAIITFYEDDGGGGLGAPATNPTTISGDYHVIVDFFGCADTAVFTVTVNPAPPAPIISGTLNVCLTNASTILDAGAGYATYQWSASNGGTISGATNMQTITATSAGDYTVIVTDANGCQNTATVTVGTFPDPGAVIIGSASFCLGQSTTLDAGAGWATYSWAATNGGNITTGTNSQTITVDASGTYTVTVTDAVTGCQDIASIDVTETTGLTPIIGGDLSICVSDGTTILDAGSGYATYTWAASGGGNISGGTNGQTITATTTGNYSVTVTDASGCSGSTTVAVTVSPNPTAAIIPTGSTYLCTGGNVNLTASGGGNYSWSPGGQSTASITVSTGGTYTVTVTDPVSGCTDVESVIATEINVQATAVAAAQNCTGTGTSIDVTPSGGTGGGYNFTWSDGSIGNVEDPTNLQYGQTYTVTVTDITTGCFIVASATTVAAPVQASIGTTTNATCNGANDGSITINVIGGKAPITYTWAGPENPGNTGNASGLNPGDYSVTVTDGDGCTVLLGPITITDPPLLTWSVPTDITICPGQSVVFSDYNGPSGGGTYSWYKNSFPPTGLLVIADNPSSNTTYYVVYTEGTCSEQTTVNLIIDAAPSFTITENPILACQGNNIIFSNYNGPEPGTFTWYDAPIPGGNIVTNITASTNATYYVLYDINGCTNTTSVDVQVTPLPTLTITPPSTLCSSSADGNSSINLDDWITASTPGTWSGTIPPGASGSFPNIDFDSVTPGVYSFTYTINAAPCSAVTGVINVSVINCQCPDVSVVPVLEVCGSVTQGLIDLTAEAQLTTEPGTWVVFDDNNATWPVQILPGAFLDATSATPGTYILHYELDNPDPDPNCPPFGETTVNVYAPPFAGTDATLDLCSNDNTTYNLINSIFDGDLGGTWSLDPSSDYNPGAAFTPATGELNPNGLAAGTLIFLYSVNPTDPLSPCLSDYALLTVNISLPGNAGTATPLTTCNTGASVVDLFAQLTGESAGGIWTVSSGSPGANFNAGAGTFNPNGLSGVFDFTYSLGANGVCPATSATVSITVNIAPSATITAPNQAMCNSSGYTPNSLNFTTLITAGDLTGTWTAITPGAPVGFPNVSFDGTTPGDFVYQYCTGIAVAPCTNPCYQITVSVVDCSCPIVASLSIPNQCNDNLNLDLDNYLAVGAAPGTWSLGITPPGSTAIINAATGVITGSGTPAGAYQVIYTLSSPKPGCPSSSSQSITLIQAPFAGNDNSQSYCTDIASVNLISLLPGANPLGTWALISGTADAGVFNAAAGTLNPSLQTTATTLVISYTVAGTSPCTDAVGSLTISIILAPEAGTGSTIDVCSNDNTIVNLGTLLTGEDLGGTWTLQSGSPIPGSFNAAAGTFNPAGQSGGAYVFQYEAVGCGLTDLETVTINITPAPDAGVGGSTTACNNDATPIDLTTLVTGYTPGGTWVSGSSFTPQGQAAGIYTFDYVLNDPNCGNDIATVTVEVFAQPQATVTNTATICNAVADGSVLNFNALITAGATNGTWTAVTPGAPAVAGGTADFDGLTPGTYNYTYTLTGTAPCSNVTYAVAVIVENCACPSPTTSTPPVLCNDAATLDLSTLTLPTTDPGAWSIESQPGGGTASLVGNNFAATGSAAGNYVVRYTLVPPPLDPNCPPYTEQTITLNAPPNAGTNGSTTACNDQVAPLDLFALLGGTPQTGGNWTNNNGASNFNAALGIGLF
ncbi:MAG: hypothetical protein IPN25_10895 [Sphingobacteriales bacterium]|nr:hypothetical protein [Sphingobacteriales bacterium]